MIVYPAGSPVPPTDENPFTDVKETDFFYKPVLWAVENGITNGLDATHFGPGSPCNRAPRPGKVGGFSLQKEHL